VAQHKGRIRVIIIFLLFIAYFLIAARPIPLETVLVPRWISSLTAGGTLSDDSSSESGFPVAIGGAVQTSGQLLPFTLGSRFGYVYPSGQFAINRVKTRDIYLSDKMWTEYDAQPETIEIKSITDDTAINIENIRGYPVLLDNRVFIIGSEQNALSEIDEDGGVLWTYDFGAPLTCIDVAAGLVLTGSVDGIIEILSSEGERIFYFEPGGSRYAIIYGCALSGDGTRIGIICGIDEQRFLLLERYGSADGEYKVVYHEFLGAGFRRPVRILFTDEDRRIIYERAGGIGCYNIRSRYGINIPLDGEIAAIDTSGDQGIFFLITSRSEQRKEFIGIKFPQEGWNLSRFKGDARDTIFLRAEFKSDDVFLGRTGSMLVAGGGTTLISFDLEER
jgi:hypothetical protein